MHAAAWPIASQFGALADDPAARAAAYAKAAPVVLFVLLLMVAQTLNGVTKLLYARGDLELMFSSPAVAQEGAFRARSRGRPEALWLRRASSSFRWPMPA